VMVRTSGSKLGSSSGRSLYRTWKMKKLSAARTIGASAEDNIAHV
jgi:hypothetical protein